MIFASPLEPSCMISNSAPPHEQLRQALNRIAKLEEELNDRDRQLEAVITDHGQDIVDLRKSFEVEMFKKPPLAPKSRQSLNGQVGAESVGWSMESVRFNTSENFQCTNCIDMQKQMRLYQKQWSEICRNFRQVPSLLEGMINRTDGLVNNITHFPTKK